MGEETRRTGAFVAAAAQVAEWLRARAGRTVGVVLGLALAFVGGRLSRSTAHAEVQTPAVQQAHALSASLRALEAELTLGDALVRHQADLKERHERVSALACSSAAGHKVDMDRIAQAHRNRGRGRVVPDSDDHSDDHSADDRATDEGLEDGPPGHADAGLGSGLNGRKVAAAPHPLAQQTEATR